MNDQGVQTLSEAIPKHTPTNGTRFDAGASERQGFATARARYATDASSLAACTSWPTRINEDKGRTRKGCKGCHGKGSTHEVERTTLLPGNHTRHQEAPQRIGEAAGSVRRPSRRRDRKRYRCRNEPQGNRRNVLEKPLREPPPMLLRPAHQGHSGLQDQDERSRQRTRRWWWSFPVAGWNGSNHGVALKSTERVRQQLRKLGAPCDKAVRAPCVGTTDVVAYPTAQNFVDEQRR